jgi:polyphenol oxidase
MAISSSITNILFFIIAFVQPLRISVNSGSEKNGFLSLGKYQTVYKKEVEGLALWQFENMPHGQVHFVSGKQGGFSKEYLAWLNLSFSAGDEPETVLRNRELLAKSLQVPFEKLVFISQCHSSDIFTVNSKSDIQEGQTGDALITNVPGLYVCVMGADCVPVLIFDPVQKVVAAIHAGWRGTAAQIVEKTIRKMSYDFGCKSQDFFVSIGPSISQANYEVGEEVYAQFKRANEADADLIFRHDVVTNKYFPDLWLANRLQAVRLGVPESQIEVSGICTFDQHDKFYSARYFKNKTGRFAAGICLT